VKTIFADAERKQPTEIATSRAFSEGVLGLENR